MMANRGIELAVEPLPGDAWLRFGRAETGEYHRLSCLSEPAALRALSVRLCDSARLIHWQPDSVELPLAGRVFAEVLKRLYDAKRWRMTLAVNLSQMACSPMSAHVRQLVGGDEDREREGLVQHMHLHGLSHAFHMPNPEDPDEPYMFMDYWWCPKRALAPVLEENWSYRSAGYVAPWPDRGALKACFRPGSLGRVLQRLLSTCKFVFQADGVSDGEAMILLSHRPMREKLEDAVQQPAVRRALQALNSEALLVEWVPRREEIGGTTYTVYEKPRPGGGGIRRVYGPDGPPDASHGPI